jgi:hypothetical protein
MSPKEYVDPEDVEQVSEDDAEGNQNHEQGEDREETEARPMTMEERKAKMQQLRAKMVCHGPYSSHNRPLKTVCSGRLHSRTVPL